MKTVLDFCTDKLCFIMPSKPITQQLDTNGIWYNMFKTAVCTNVETVKQGTFKNTNIIIGVFLIKKDDFFNKVVYYFII